MLCGLSVYGRVCPCVCVTLSNVYIYCDFVYFYNRECTLHPVQIKHRAMSDGKCCSDSPFINL